MAQEFVERGAILNINVGILGHVDSGKTSLVKSLSTSLSTAALDKNPQSQQRGITLDLGFSAFTLPMPEHLISSTIHDYDSIQFTLVDCPGHASLIRTIIGGAQIIDMILLVIDANKGIQTQTAECIVIGEITTDNMIIVMNKIDMLPENEREVRIERMTKRIRKIFATTKFANVPIIHTAAAIGGEKVAATSASNGVAMSGQSSKGKSNAVQSSGIDTLVDLIKRTVQLPVRNMDSPFYFAIDHCFPIKGHGTVLTGTVLSGSISLNQLIEIPHMQITRKVKSLQMFRKPVRIARQGDRVGICVTNLDPNTIERSIAAHPGSVPLLSSVICLVKKVRFFKGACKSNTKFHVSIGHTTIISTAVFFGAAELSEIIAGNTAAIEAINDITITNSSTSKQPTSSKLILANKQSALNATYQHNFPSVDFDFSSDCQFQAEMAGAEEGSVQYGAEPVQWVLLQFQQPVFCPIGSLVIGSRLDADTRETSNGGLGNSGAASQCRLAFYGPVRESLTEDEYDKIRVFSWKSKNCEVFRITDVRNGFAFEVIGWRLVSETGSVTPFIGMHIETESGAQGTIVSSFGSGGKFRAKFPNGARLTAGGRLVLRYKRYLYDKTKSMRQSGMPPPLSVVEEAAHHHLQGLELTDDSDSSGRDERLGHNNQQQGAQWMETVQGVAFDAREGGSAGGGGKTGKRAAKALQYQQQQQKQQHQTSSAAVNTTQLIVSDVAPTTTLVTESVVSSSAHSPAPLPSPPAVVSSPSNVIAVFTPPAAPTATVITQGTAPSSSSASQQTINTGCSRVGRIESLKGDVLADGVHRGFDTAIVAGAFRMEENIRLVVESPDTTVTGPNGERGELIGPFGKLGKCKVKFAEGCVGPVDGYVTVCI